MPTQGWIIHKGGFLSLISHWPRDQRPNLGVVLAAGFSQPMCDTDYFMSKLARRLANSGTYVLQFDMRGHGDSSGELEDVTLQSLREDLQVAVDYARQQTGEKTLCIGRGLSLTLMAELVNISAADGTAGINPYCLKPYEVKKTWEGLCSEKYELSDIFEGTDYAALSDFSPEKIAFFDALGADIINLHGQRISGQLFEELKSYAPDSVLELCKENALWLVPSRVNEEEADSWKPGLKSYWMIEENKRNLLPRNPMWQYKAIDKICSWVETYKEEILP